METIRLRRENINLEKKNKELLAQISELSTKNKSLSKEILNMKYSNRDVNSSQYSINNIITELNKTISDLSSKLNQVINEKNKLEKMNKDLTASINANHTEKYIQSNDNNERINYSLEIKNLNERVNKDKTLINEIIQKNNKLNKKMFELQNENEKINKEINDANRIKEDYQEKYYKISKKLNEEKEINSFNEQKIKKLERKLEEYNINDFDDSKTKTYKIGKINKVNEIEVEKLTKKFNHSPLYAYRKNTSTFSTNNTSHNRRVLANNLEEVEISPDNYTIVKQFKLNNNLKWNLFKKIKKQNSGVKEENNSPSSNQIPKQQFRRHHYLKLNSRSKSNNNIFYDDSYSDFVWRPNKNEKDFINFNIQLIENDLNENSISREKQKKIKELETCIKDLEDKLEKKENDCHRINLNYAKLFKRSKLPELSYEKLLENIDKLKKENKYLIKKIENLKYNQNFIGFSFIEDDLEGSRFIDDKCFEAILDEIDNKNNNNQKNDINMMKYFNSHEDDKINKDKDMDKEKDLKDNCENKRKRKYLYYSRSRKSLIDNKDDLKIDDKAPDSKCNDNEINKENINTIQIKSLMNKAHINYFRKDINSPNKIENEYLKENKEEEKKNKKIGLDNDDKKIRNIYDNKNETIIAKNRIIFHKKTNSSGKEIKNDLKVEKSNCKTDNRIYPRTTRYRRSYKSNVNVNSVISSEINSNDKKNEIKNEKKDKDTLDNHIKDISIKNENEKIEKINENITKINPFSGRRRFYQRKNDNLYTIENNDI